MRVARVRRALEAEQTAHAATRAEPPRRGPCAHGGELARSGPRRSEDRTDGRAADGRATWSLSSRRADS